MLIAITVMEKRETMVTFKRFFVTAVIVLAGSTGIALAQARLDVAGDQIRAKQQMATMEAVLRQAVVSGAQNVITQLRNVVRDSPRLGTPKASGVRLDGYGLVFHVEVPEFVLPIMWDVLVREAQYRNAAMQVQQLRNQVRNMQPGPERNRALEMLFQLEQGLTGGNLRAPEGGRDNPGGATLIPAGVPGKESKEPSVVDDPESAYTREVKTALIDAMLTNSQGLGVGAEEWLTIIAIDGVPNNPQFPGDAIDASTWVMRVKGSVLAAFRAETISKEEARKQVEVREQ